MLDLIAKTLVVVREFEAVTFTDCMVAATRAVVLTEVIFAFVENMFANGTVTFPIPTVEELANMFP